MAATESAAAIRGPVPGLAKIVGFLVCVEIASGVLQGYYTPIYQDIARHLSIEDASVNWFEAAQLVVSALAVPFLARLGDLVEASGQVVRAGRSMVFIRGLITCGAEPLLNFSGVVKKLKPRGSASA